MWFSVSEAHAQTLAETPTSVSFGTVATGTKNSQTVVLSNSSRASITVSSVSVSGTGFSRNSMTLPATISSGHTLSVTVNFAPTATGSVTGTLTVSSNASNPTLKAALSGSGGSATRIMSLSTSSLSFGNEVVGGSIPLVVGIKNTGNSSLTISGISVSGTGYSVASGVSGATISAGQTANLTVMFAPTATGTVSGKITISSNASTSPNTVLTTGTGVSNTGHFATLTWSASSSSGVVGYYVYRSTTSGSSYSRITSSAFNSEKYTDGSVAAGITYYYVVTAVNSSGAESAHSSQVTAKIP